MKKILAALPIIAILATSCNDKKAHDANIREATAVTSSGTAASADIVYFNIDSVISNYNMYIDLRSTYETKAKKAEEQLNTKGRALERDIASYQDRANKGLMTTSQIRTAEEDLQKKQQSFVQFQEQTMAELGEEERVMFNNIYYNINEFLKEFNKDYRYGMIISTGTTGPVMNADPRLNITGDILDGLNKKYAADLKSGASITAPAE